MTTPRRLRRVGRGFRTPWTMIQGTATLALPTTSTAQSRWGSTSIVLNANAQQNTSLSFSKSGVPATNSLSLGGLIPIGNSETFTYEAWIRLVVAGNERIFFDAGNGGIALGLDANGRFFLGMTAVGYGVFTTGFTPVVNTWYHVVWMRAASDARFIFVDGVLRGYGNDGSTANFSFLNPSGNPAFVTPTVGNNAFNPTSGGTTPAPFSCFLNDFRINRGAIYPTNVTTIGNTAFTPPTGPLINLPSTALLMPGDDGRLIDDIYR